ncbi:hypothetical protein QQY24_22810 [Streptomyces sp. TG1A-8]|uniref:SCO2102 family sporulation regulator n=1 Tax=Streptomyces sp. TG1A-8 TaxID=3051385 RepID=UPI00265B7D27|nr:hypothetical protein [Streptomyces sp. TG1A-8]MDO0928104.1 hypothetical protein [Streptomyces sp. TG1A-8]
MGWTVLYTAFGVVALWLLGEVLLQYKARLRWRLLAFAGFLGVVLGVLMPSVIVIGVGAIAFATGQTYVTLSFRRGFAAGWAVKRPEAGSGGSKRRRGRAGRHDPTLEVSDLRAAGDAGRDEPARTADGSGSGGTGGYDDHGGYGDDGDDVFAPGRPAAGATAVYAPQPLPEDTGSYGVYGDASAAAPPQDAGYATAAQGTGQAHAYDHSGYGGQTYGYDTGDQQGYANYSDPYIGTQAYGGDAYGTGYDQQYAQQAHAQDPYGTGGYGETPAGGVWVPQQRTDEAYGGELPQEQPYPYQGDGQQQPYPGAGYDEQYRF